MIRRVYVHVVFCLNLFLPPPFFFPSPQRRQVNNLQTDKEKLESYTKKTLHKFQDKYMVAISHCKAQIAEKNEKIDYLEVCTTLVLTLSH